MFVLDQSKRNVTNVLGMTGHNKIVFDIIRILKQPSAFNIQKYKIILVMMTAVVASL